MSLLTVTSLSQAGFRMKGSRFLGYLFPVNSVKSFENQLESIKNDHPTATHYCYSWRIGPSNPKEFTQDDGEPAGTAGLPVLNELKSNELTNTGLVVVRYYGGTKLGKPGLIEAYGLTAGKCIEHADLARIIPTCIYRIRYAYEYQNLYEKWKNRYCLIEKESGYTEDVIITLACPDSYSEEFYRELEASGHLLSEYDKLEPSFEIELL